MWLPALELRVGIHTGPVISGVVGNRRFSFDIWGDAVNTASFIEAHCPPGQINISETVAGHVKALFELEARGTIKAKHDRPYRMFFLNRLKPEFASDEDGRAPNDNFNAYHRRVRATNQSIAPNNVASQTARSAVPAVAKEKTTQRMVRW